MTHSREIGSNPTFPRDQENLFVISLVFGIDANSKAMAKMANSDPEQLAQVFTNPLLNLEPQVSAQVSNLAAVARSVINHLRSVYGLDDIPHPSAMRRWLMEDMVDTTTGSRPVIDALSDPTELESMLREINQYNKSV